MAGDTEGDVLTPERASAREVLQAAAGQRLAEVRQGKLAVEVRSDLAAI